MLYGFRRLTYPFIGAALLACGGDSADGTSSEQTSVTIPAGTPGPAGDCTDEARTEILALVNDARAEGTTCGATAYSPVGPLTWNCTMETAAIAHSVDMGRFDIVEHTGSDGLSPGGRLSAAGYHWSRVGENIAAGPPTPEVVVQGWLDSPGHCTNIMNGDSEEMAIGWYEPHPERDTTYTIYWTQKFATPLA